jgi:hypothetical protein
MMFFYEGESFSLSSHISFAWEEDSLKTNIVDAAIAGTKETNILLVIGYSFPFFNREVDRKIIGAMTGLEKVYFQAPDADDLKERFFAIRDDAINIKLVPRKDLKQFVFPHEF